MASIALLSNKRNPRLNRIAKDDAPVHRWYRFVLSFPPHLVRDYIQEFKHENESFILDPFCGTGTALVEAKKLSQPSIGVEAHPMMHYASFVKTDWGLNAALLRESAARVADFSLEEISRPKKLLTFAPEEEELLLKKSICPVPLHKLLALKKFTESSAHPRVKNHLFLALAKIAVGKASNLHFGPEVGVRGEKKDADVLNDWLEEVGIMADDLDEVQNFASVHSAVFRDDARRPDFSRVDRKIGLVITSPPYPNEKDYTRTTRLETVLLSFAKNRDELRNIKRGLIRSNTRTVYKYDTDAMYVNHMKEIVKLAEKIETRRRMLQKTSGFEKQYHKVVLQYFGGMAQHLGALRPYLKKGAYLAYVVGDQASFFRILIRTGTILKDIAEELGYQHVRTDLFRERIATATGDFLREEVLILRWPN